MTDTTAVLLYLPIILATVVAFVGSLQAYLRQKKGGSLLWLLTMLLCWQFADVIYYAMSSPQVARFFADVKIPFVSFSAVAMLFLCLEFFHLEKSMAKGMRFVLLLLPCITAFLALTSQMHTLLRKELTIITAGALHEQVLVQGTWYWIHVAYCIVLMIAAMWIIFHQHQKLPKEHRTASTLLMLSISLALVGAAITITGFWMLPVGGTLLFTTAGAVLIYVSVMRYDYMDFLMLARAEIFNFLDSYIFILDNKQVILERNLAARRWMERLGMSVFEMKYMYDVISELECRGASFRKGLEDDDGVDIEMEVDGQVVIYNMYMREIKDKTGAPIGMFATCTEVTGNRQLLGQYACAGSVPTTDGAL